MSLQEERRLTDAIRVIRVRAAHQGDMARDSTGVVKQSNRQENYPAVFLWADMGYNSAVSTKVIIPMLSLIMSIVMVILIFVLVLLAIAVGFAVRQSK